MLVRPAVAGKQDRGPVAHGVGVSTTRLVARLANLGFLASLGIPPCVRSGAGFAAMPSGG